MDYLVTGATGFIGQNIVSKLLSEGHSVSYLARKRSRTLDSRAAFHCWNLEQMPPLNSIPVRDIVIHLAGEPIAQRWSEDVKGRIRESRVEGTRKLVSAIGDLKHKPSVLISASAVGYYGDRGDEMLTESSPSGSGFLADVCVDWEREALRAREFGLRVVVVRIAPVLGRNGGMLKSMLIPFRLGLGGKLGSGRQWMPWIHMDDLVRLFVFAAESQPVEGSLNASSPNPVTNKEFTKALAGTLHRPAILPLPKLALKLLAGELADSIFNSARVVPKTTEASGFRFEYPDLRIALRSLF